ncbi:MAG: transglutaminase family protein [Rikenellaceae bacterium]
MRRYRFSYQTIVRYDRLVSNHDFMLRCMPLDYKQQRLVDEHIHLLGGAEYQRSEDNFGNTIVYGSMKQKHDIFVVAVCGVVDCLEYKVEEEKPSRVFLSSTPKTMCTSYMACWANEVPSEGSSLEQALALSSYISSYMSYAPSVTNTETTASESFELRQGVCQDYSHLLISLCRERGILARYVAGFMAGTGETHAWVEVHCEGAWYGIDPTHNTLIEYGYVKVSHGRDAADCSVVRGMHRGRSAQSTQVRVIVEQLDARYDYREFQSM